MSKHCARKANFRWSWKGGCFTCSLVGKHKDFFSVMLDWKGILESPDSDSGLRSAGLWTKISVQNTQNCVTKVAPHLGLGLTQFLDQNLLRENTQVQRQSGKSTRALESSPKHRVRPSPVFPGCRIRKANWKCIIFCLSPDKKPFDWKKVTRPKFAICFATLSKKIVQATCNTAYDRIIHWQMGSHQRWVHWQQSV